MGKKKHHHFVPKIYQQGFSETIDRGSFIGEVILLALLVKQTVSFD